MFIREEYDNYIYSDEYTLNIINIRNVNNSFWTVNTQFSIGYSSISSSVMDLNWVIDLYRFRLKRDYPLITSIASDMNAVILNVKIGFGF